MQLNVGDQLPDFTGLTWQKKVIDSRTLRGRPLWLGLYRYASCPLCNLRIHEIIQCWPELAAAGLQKLAVFESDADSIAAHVGQQAPPFPLLADPQEKLYALLGAQSSWAGFIHPGNVALLAQAARAGFLPGKMEGTKSRLPMDLLVDQNGVIRALFRASKIGDHIPFATVTAFLAGL